MKQQARKRPYSALRLATAHNLFRLKVKLLFYLFRFFDFLFVSFRFDLLSYVSICFFSVSFRTLQRPGHHPISPVLHNLRNNTIWNLIISYMYRYAACSSSSRTTCSVFMLSNVLFLCQISVIFVSCTQRPTAYVCDIFLCFHITLFLCVSLSSKFLSCERLIRLWFV